MNTEHGTNPPQGAQESETTTGRADGAPNSGTTPHGAKNPSRSPEERIADAFLDVAVRFRRLVPAERVEELERELARVNDMHADAVAQVRPLEMQLSGSRAVAERLRGDLERRDEQIEGYKGGVFAAERAFERVTRQLADMTTERVSLHQSMDRKDRRIAELQARNDTQAATIARISEERESFRASGFVHEDQLGVLDRSVERLIEQLASMTAERDAAAENARRERDRRGTYTNDELVSLADVLLETLRMLGSDDLLGEGKAPVARREIIVENILRRKGLRSMTEQKPVVRVVTSPRFYSDEQREEAAQALRSMIFALPAVHEDKTGSAVDTIAEALGMRRAKS